MVQPGNAEEVIQDVCPDADFVVIVTDKNLYLPMNVDEERDVYPHVPRVYLDMLDLRYGRVDDWIEEIAGFIRAGLGRGAGEG